MALGDIQYLAHEGSNGPFYARALLCRQLNYGVVFLCNAGNEQSVAGVQFLMDKIDEGMR